MMTLVLVTEKFISDNFHTCQVKMQLYLIEKGVGFFLDTIEPKPKDVDELAKWEVKYRKSLGTY